MERRLAMQRAQMVQELNFTAGQMETITKMVFKGASEETGFDATKGTSMDQVT